MISFNAPRKLSRRTMMLTAGIFLIAATQGALAKGGNSGGGMRGPALGPGSGAHVGMMSHESKLITIVIAETSTPTNIRTRTTISTRRSASTRLLAPAGRTRFIPSSIQIRNLSPLLLRRATPVPSSAIIVREEMLPAPSRGRSFAITAMVPMENRS
jgi:hypothetical protein